MEILYGGILALPGKGGLDSHSWWPTFLGVPAEYMESYYPLIIEEYSARRDSCGAGKFREGCGVRKVYRFLADGSIIFQDDRAHTYPYGGDGGKPSTPSAKTLIWQSGEHQVALRGARRPRLRRRWLGLRDRRGCCLGDPLERGSESVAKDIRWNLVTHEAAEEEYGVVLNDGGEGDTEETETRREGLGVECLEELP